jgi:hypothetical protein
VDQATPGTVEGFSSRGPVTQFFPAQVTSMKPPRIPTKSPPPASLKSRHHGNLAAFFRL